MEIMARLHAVTDLVDDPSDESVMRAFLLRLEKNHGIGGLAGLLQALRDQGLERQVDSWIIEGGNMGLPPERIERLLGGEELGRLAGDAGLPRRETAQRLARLLPALVDKLTPSGRWDDDVANAGLILLRGRTDPASAASTPNPSVGVD